MKESSTTDCTQLRIHDPNYAQQATIQPNKVRLLRDLSLQLKLHIPSVIRYLGEDYVGDHLPRRHLLKRLRPLVPHKLFNDIKRVLTYGSPAKFEGYSTNKNFWEYKRYGNHTSVTKKVENTLAIINKEDRNKFLLTFPNWLARFIPHLHITPSGLVVIPGKKGRLIFDASFRMHILSQFVNLWTHKNHEPPLVFPKALLKHLTRVYNLRISYPNSEI